MLTAKNLAEYAEQAGIPLRTLDDVRAALEQARLNQSDKSLARLMLKFGRLTNEARAFVEAWNR